MLTNEEMISLQAEKHKLVGVSNFSSKEEYVLHLIHCAAYNQASYLAENKTVLDLGCNIGYGAEIISRSASKVIGVDVSERAVTFAKALYGQHGIEFQKVGGEKLPFEDSCFDMVVSFQVIEHIVDHHSYIGELQRVLSPDGIAIFTTPNAQLRLDPGMKPWNKFHVREYSSSKFKVLLDNYFSETKVLGLFANEPIYSIEITRLAKAREKARKIEGMPIMAAIKKIIPEKILEQAKELFNPIWSSVDNYSEFIGEHGVEELYYGSDGLESSLDLMAICANNGRIPEEYRKKLAIISGANRENSD